MPSRPTVCIIIIGDEILKGQTMDTNSHFLCEELYRCGIKVSRVLVIPDEIDTIAEEVHVNSKKHTFVLTSGGIGPTHDDVTYEGIAKAFSENIILKQDLHKMIINLCLGLGLDEKAAFKMSHVPESSEIHYIYTSKQEPSFPVISVKNVYAFSGIPSYLKVAFSQLKFKFSNNSVAYFTQNLYLDASEFVITEILNEAVREFDGLVKFGSYPDIRNDYYQVKITLEADSEIVVQDAEAFLRSHLPNNIIVGQYDPDSTEAFKKFESILNNRLKTYDAPFSERVKKSLEIIDECFDTYSFDSICLSFNGGKDCTALLHLTYMFLKKLHIKRSKLKVVYIRSRNPFTEIEDFIYLCVKRYSLDLITYDSSIKDGLKKLRTDYPNIKAILIGSRSTDPHCSDLKAFQMTDDDWPQFMRVSPLIYWSYEQVWKFLRYLEVPYCGLYDKGYTSVGCKNNTTPNSKLLTKTKDGKSYYLPAYMLKETQEEREGRVSNASLA